MLAGWDYPHVLIVRHKVFLLQRNDDIVCRAVSTCSLHQTLHLTLARLLILQRDGHLYALCNGSASPHDEVTFPGSSMIEHFLSASSQFAVLSYLSQQIGLSTSAHTGNDYHLAGDKPFLVDMAGRAGCLVALHLKDIDGIGHPVL